MLTEWVENAAGSDGPLWITLSQVATSLGAVGIAVALGRYGWNWFRWRKFKRAVRDWITSSADPHSDHPKMPAETAWAAKVEQLLADAYFGPFESQVLIDLAVAVAKQIADTVLV